MTNILEAIRALLTELENQGATIRTGSIAVELPDGETLRLSEGWAVGDPWVILRQGQRVGPGGEIKED